MVCFKLCISVISRGWGGGGRRNTGGDLIAGANNFEQQAMHYFESLSGLGVDMPPPGLDHLMQDLSIYDRMETIWNTYVVANKNPS